jgi:CO/xanthine dehydrogenase Mo-binding subunit
MVESQLCGGMIWGLSFALHERAVMDARTGRPMNPNLGEYHIPVNADVPSLEAIILISARNAAETDVSSLSPGRAIVLGRRDQKPAQSRPRCR